MSLDSSNDLEILRLQVEAALTIMPIISKPIAFQDDQMAIIADVVDYWMALPQDSRSSYLGIGAPERSGLTYFTWEYIDVVEFKLDLSQGGGLQIPEIRPAKHLLFERWLDRLDVVKTRQDTGGQLDQQWLAAFPLYSQE
jgi:hypothetical protein